MEDAVTILFCKNIVTSADILAQDSNFMRRSAETLCTFIAESTDARAYVTTIFRSIFKSEGHLQLTDPVQDFTKIRQQVREDHNAYRSIIDRYSLFVNQNLLDK
jgi:hypothetical protein